MKGVARLVALVCLAALTVADGEPAQAAQNAGASWRRQARANKDTFNLDVWLAEQKRLRALESKARSMTPPPEPAKAPVELPPRLVRHTPVCDVNDLRQGPDAGAMCPRAVALCAHLGAGSYRVWTFTSTVLHPTTADWHMAGSRCVRPGEDIDGGRRIPAFTGHDLARLKLPASPAHVEPPGGEVLINIETNVYTTPRTRTLRTRLLGIDLEIEARPVTFTWDFGDGERLVVSDPGHPYPNMTTTHVYTQPGRYTVTLTTEYAGRYRVANSPDWLPVDGTATVTGPPSSLLAYEARAVLVP